MKYQTKMARRRAVTGCRINSAYVSVRQPDKVHPNVPQQRGNNKGNDTFNKELQRTGTRQVTKTRRRVRFHDQLQAGPT